MIDITSREQNGVLIVEIEGKMGSVTSAEVEKYLNSLLDKGITKILLNLEKLDFITSTGLRVMLSTGQKLHKIGGKMAISNPNLTVKDILEMSGFSQIFNVFETEDHGLNSF